MKTNSVRCEKSGTVTIRIPFSVRKRGGRKLVIVPENAEAAPSPRRSDSTLIKALARAHRWKRMLEGEGFSSIAELAKAEKINESYLCRILRLTLLAPDIVDLILDGRQPSHVQLDTLLKGIPIEWHVQFAVLGPVA
jgi:hypothetical protein